MSDGIKFITPTESFVSVMILKNGSTESMLLNLSAIAYVQANTITMKSGEMITVIKGEETFEDYIINLANFCGSKT